MSGLGGGGAMVLYRAHENRYEVIDYGMRAPNSLRVEDYPLTGSGAASDIFPWPRVKDDRNLHGPGSIAVPGVVAGMEEAHRRHAKMPWKELLAPGIAARRRRPAGGLVDHADDRKLRRRPAALSGQRCRLSAGRPAAERAMGHQVRGAAAAGHAEGDAGATRRRGPRDFYEGELARSIAADIKAAGGALSVEDLAAFRAHVREPLVIPYRGGKVFATPELTAARRWRTRCACCSKNSSPGRAAGCRRLHRICAGAAIGLSRAALRHGRCRRPPRARRRTSGAGLHHAFLGGRPRRQHGRGDADPALELRLEIRDAAIPASP